MFNEKDYSGFSTPQPAPHQHGPASAVQSFPIRDNCNGGYPMGGDGWNGMGPGREAPPAQERECTPVPPPIPPVRYVPGMNVQEQLSNMADRVNVSINRWNQIQANCYKALDEVVGAAVNNDVYYAPDEVRFMEGYSEDAGCSYALVEARACDRSGKPIFCHLRPAYNNETNSGARENITDVSFVTSAQMVITAVQATETRWKGTTVFNGNSGASTPDDTVWICGWTRNGVLRFFQGDVSEDTLRQNRMVSCIGPVFPILKDHKAFTQVLGSMGEEPGSIQAIGWKPNGNKVFFNCGSYDQPGMTPTQVMKTMQSLGCATAVITSYQTKAVTAWDATPIAGTESAMTYADDSSAVISVPGMTGSMTFLGKLTSAPIQWSVPQNCANWVITKRPPRGWRNAFTTEVANVVQRLGNQENSMNSILGQLTGENEAISKMQYDIQQNANNIASLSTTVGGFDGRISELDSRMDSAEAEITKNTASIKVLQSQLDAEITTRQGQYNELKQADAMEKAERQAADSALQADINAEKAARESADTILQNNINQEVSDREAADSSILADLDTERKVRAQSDQNLMAAIEAETSARQTKDAQHEAQMEALAAQEQKDNAAQQAEIEALKDGSALPIATREKLGAIKVGKNLTIEEDGTLNALGGGSGGDNVVEGDGISISENEAGQKVISVDDTVVTQTQLDTEKTRIDALEEAEQAQAEKDAEQDAAINKVEEETTEKISSLEKEISTLDDTVSDVIQNVKDIQGKQTEDEERLNKAEQDITEIGDSITNIGDTITNINQEITNIQNGSGLPIASADTLGAVKIGANLSISEDGTLSASAGEEGGENVAQGNGITVEHNEETKVATISLNADTQETLASVKDKADKTQVDALETAVAGKADNGTVETLTEEVEKKADKSTVDALETVVESKADTATVEALSAEVEKKADKTVVDALSKSVTDIGTDLDGLKDTVNDVKETAENTATEVDGIKTDVSGLEQRVTAAEEKDDAQDVEITSVKGEVEALKEAGESQASEIAGLTGEVAKVNQSLDDKVNRAGDTMTGNLQLNAAKLLLADATGKVIGEIGTEGGVITINGLAEIMRDVETTPTNIILRGVSSPVENSDAANKMYVDTEIDEVGQLAQNAANTATLAGRSASEAKTAASTAQTTANNALTTANNALPKSGGIMTGQIVTANTGIKQGGSADFGYGLVAPVTCSQFHMGKIGTEMRAGFTTALTDFSDAESVILGGIATPTLNHHAANKAYVDSKASGVAWTSITSAFSSGAGVQMTPQVIKNVLYVLTGYWTGTRAAITTSNHSIVFNIPFVLNDVTFLKNIITNIHANRGVATIETLRVFISDGSITIDEPVEYSLGTGAEVYGCNTTEMYARLYRLK